LRYTSDRWRTKSTKRREYQKNRHATDEHLIRCPVIGWARVALALAGTYWMLWGVAELTTRWAPGLISHRSMK